MSHSPPEARATIAESAPRAVWELRAQLGEGPIWVERDSAVWFVDIKQLKIHRFDPASGARRSWDSPEPCGFLFPAEGGGFVAGLQSGLYHFDQASGGFDLIARVEADKPTNRLNDGVVDPSGRLWFGTMDDREKDKTGAFYCFANGRVTPAGVGGITITNGPAVSPDGKLLYLVDTRRGTIRVADIDENGSLGEPRPFVRIDAKDGHPDGPTVDGEGCVWIALYAGWEAWRYSPSGALLERVRFPAANITKLAFGGPDLRTAFATTARQLLSAEQIAEQPLIGSLFEFRVGTPGLPCPLVRL
jgi:sugar lactone lactonase YvrE